MTISQITYSIMIISQITYSIMIISTDAYSIVTTTSIMTLLSDNRLKTFTAMPIVILIGTVLIFMMLILFNYVDECHYAALYYAECHYALSSLSKMLNVIISEGYVIYSKYVECN